MVTKFIAKVTIPQLFLLILLGLQCHQTLCEQPARRNDKSKKTPYSRTGSYTYVTYGDPVTRFHNDGRLRGWDKHHHEKDGRVKEIENRKTCFHSAKAKDDHCLLFQQTYDPEYRGRYHSEVILYKAAVLHQATYYGMAFKLANDFVFDEPWKKGEKAEHIRIHIMQFIASFKDIDCGHEKKMAVPTTMVWLENDNVFTKVRFGDICHDRHNIKKFWIGKAIPGRWHTFVIGAHWHNETEEGWFNVVYDKKVVVNEKKIRTFPDIDNRTFELRVGLYPNWYSWDGKGHPFIGDRRQRTKRIYIDEISFGPTYGDADPHGALAASALTTKKYKKADRMSK